MNYTKALDVPNTIVYDNGMEQHVEFEQLLSWVCDHNTKAPNKDRIIVDFDTGYCDYATIRAQVTQDRNAACACGSGRKYKKCCMK